MYHSVVWAALDGANRQAQRARLLRWRFNQYPQIAAQIPAEDAAIESALRLQSARLRQLFPGASAAPRAVVVLAPDFDSKSGVLPDGTPVLALAADTLVLEKANLQILLPHELFECAQR